MRLCFNGFCLGPQRPLAVEQSSQTVLTLSTAIDTLNVTTFFDKTSSPRHVDQAQENSFHAVESKSSFFEKFAMINPDEASFQGSFSATNPTMFSHNNDNSSPTQYTVNATDSQNNNLVSSSSEIELVKSDVVDSLNNTVENFYINESFDVNMQEIDNGLTPKEKELIKAIQLKDIKINELNHMLLQKNDEIANLKSHLDKFQSVFSGFRSGAMGRKIGRNLQRQRVGISAEPQSESSMHDLLSVTFPKYEKEEP